MNKIAAKPPSDNTDWEAIDIYLFSNGQQYSPPRKYHLTNRDLNLWDATINYLARAHYGSLHKVIELYTLNGSKIKTPLDLKNGTSYVAVIPPDAFINSGYEKYLVKASRSWEKRQAKRSSKADISEDRRGQSQIEESLTKLNMCMTRTVNELTTIKSPDDNVTVESVLVKPRKIAPNYNKPDLQQPRRSIISSASRFDKKRSSTQPTFTKAPSTLEQSKDKCDCKTKETFNRKPLIKVPVKISVPVNELALKVEKITKPTNKSAPTVTISPPQILSQIPSVLLELQNIPQTEVNQITTSNKSLVTDNLPNPSLIDKETNVSVDGDILKNVDSETKLENKGTYGVVMVDKIISCTLLGIDNNTQAQIELKTAEVNTSNIGLFNNNRIEVIPGTIHGQPNVINCNIPVDDNYIAVINKGDVINMILQIGFQNDDTNYKNQISTREIIRKSSSLTNVLKRKSESGVDEKIMETKSFRSISGINDAIVKVECISHCNNISVSRTNTTPVYQNENGFFILTPGLIQSENQRCVCSKNNGICYGEKQAKTEMCIQDLCRSTSVSVLPCGTRQVGIVSAVVDVTDSQINKNQSNACNAPIRTKQSVYVNEKECTKENCDRNCDIFLLNPQKLEQTEKITPKSKPQESPHRTEDSYTQTGWCNVLLEVKSHEDGRYSFHLPPLSLLKMYSR